MRLIRRFFVTITAAFIMFSAGHTASNAAGHYYTASKPGAANNTCVLTYKLCNAGYYLENGMCNQCPIGFTTEALNAEMDAKTDCTITLDPGEYYDLEKETIETCPEGYYCPGGAKAYDKNNNFIGRVECPAGYYCPGGEQAFDKNNKYIGRFECDAGYYCPGGEQAFDENNKYIGRFECDAGYYCPETKQSDKNKAQHECGFGNYCVAGSAQPTACPKVPTSASVNEWLPAVITGNEICNIADAITADDIKHKQEPAFVSYKTKVGAETDCQIKLEVNIPCGLVHIYHIQYDPDKQTYSNTANLTSYYMSLNKGYYLYDRLYEDNKCESSEHPYYDSPLYYSKSSPCENDVRDYCFGLTKMPANCGAYNTYPDKLGIFECNVGQYKLENTDPTTNFPIFADCPIGSYCEKCQIYTCPTGATSEAGSDEITDCYLNNKTKFKDSKGTFSLPMGNINIIATGK